MSSYIYFVPQLDNSLKYKLQLTKYLTTISSAPF